MRYYITHKIYITHKTSSNKLHLKQKHEISLKRNENKFTKIKPLMRSLRVLNVF